MITTPFLQELKILENDLIDQVGGLKTLFSFSSNEKNFYE